MSLPMNKQPVDTIEEISKFIFTSKYANFLEDLNRRETLEETVARGEQMHLKHFRTRLTPDNIKEIRWAFDLVRQKRIAPSMRSLQFGGRAVEKHNQRIYNCFDKETPFVTRFGVKTFSDFENGDQTTVLTDSGRWKKATVVNYGVGTLNKITISKGKHEILDIFATPDHRWILKDGRSTESLAVGDSLKACPPIFSEFVFDSAPPDEKLYWCYGYVYGDGTLVGKQPYSMVRLCDHASRFRPRFEEMGFSTSSSLSLKGDFMAFTGKYAKTAPSPETDSPNLIRAFVKGYLDADGQKNPLFSIKELDASRNGNAYITIQSSQQDHISFIRKCFPIAGVYIISETDLTGQETNFGVRPYTISFRICQADSVSTPYRVKSIQENYKKDGLWCLEVEDDKSFVFPNGLTTGNCSVRHIDSLRSFSEIFHLLLCGCGVGFGLSKFFLNRLPDLVDAQDKTGSVITYVLNDDIESWSDSVEALLSCYFKNTAYTGRKIVFDYSRIRKKGEKLKTTCGKAPGYKPLKEAHLRIKALLDYIIEDLGLSKIRSIDVYDIILHAADAVLSGGIRRSSCCAVFEKDDQLMIESKVLQKVDRSWAFDKIEKGGKVEYHGRVTYKGKKIDVVFSGMSAQYDYDLLKKDGLISWMLVEPQRKRANNSVLLLRNEVSFEEFSSIVERTKQYGEPGFVFADHPWTLFNPCQPAWAPVIIKRLGLATIGDIIIGDEIWSKEGWTEVIAKWSTGVKPVFKWITDGYNEVLSEYSYFVGTENHRVVSNGEKIEISKTDSIDFFSNDSENGAALNIDTHNCKIVDVEALGEQEVFDLTVSNNSHTYWTGGCDVSNCFEISFIPVTEDGRCGVQFCNLTTMNGRLITTAQEFFDCAKASAIIGTLQAGYTEFRYLGRASKELTEAEALLGCSITGMMDNPKILLDPELQRQAADLIIETNLRWAKILGLNPASRTTALKPEGTSSLYFGCANGCHGHHDKERYFRRVVCNKLEAPYRFFKKHNPHMCEEYVHNVNGTDDVVTFPIIPPKGAIGKDDLSALEHLKIILSTKKNWINTGSKNSKKPLTHNISCTVSVKDDEWAGVIKFLFDNKNEFAAVSLFPYFGDKIYAQAPNERIYPENEEKWKNILENMVPVDYTQMKEKEDSTHHNQEIACQGGACELVTV